MLNMGFCTIQNKTKGKLPRLPFVSIKNEILGKDYELGVTFLSSEDQRGINLKYRGKSKTTNILSFPLSKNVGEITIDPVKVRAESPLFGMTYSKFMKYLFIHGLLHLKGFDHSSTMEKEEEKYLRIFS